MPSILGANEIKATGYNVANSVRLNPGDSPNLTRTPGSASNRRTWTWSGWVKRSGLGSIQTLFNGSDGNYPEIFYFAADDTFIYHHDISGTDYKLISTQVFRDVSAWYHIVVAKDTTQSTETNRLKVYVNGSQITMNESALGYPTQNFQGAINIDDLHIIGNWKTNSYYIDGYLTEVAFIDGTQLDADSFGEFDEDSPNIWKPKDGLADDLTFGTNGFYLDFEDSSALGNDVSGNNNDYTANNLAATDQSTDTCTNNFCTLNPLYKQDHAFSEGNLGYTSSASDWDSAPGTIAVSSGKWYVEMKITGDAGGVTRSVLGLCDERDGNIVAESEFGLTSSVVGDTVGYTSGTIHKNSSDTGATAASFAVNDIIGMYVDLDNGKVYFSKNGTMQNSGDPTSGSTGTGAISITTGATYLFGATGYGGGASQMNFGSPPYAVSSGNADPNGYGNFEYGTQNYYALNTKNLAEYG